MSHLLCFGARFQIQVISSKICPQPLMLYITSTTQEPVTKEQSVMVYGLDLIFRSSKIKHYFSKHFSGIDSPK